MAAIKEKMNNLETELREPLKEYLRRVYEQLKEKHLARESILHEAYPNMTHTTFLESDGKIRKTGTLYGIAMPDAVYAIDEFVDGLDLTLMKRIVDHLVSGDYK